MDTNKSVQVNTMLLPHIKYAIDIKGVAITDIINQKTEFISYPKAAVWLILLKQYPFEKAIQMLCAILQLPENNCAKLIKTCQGDWEKYFTEKNGESIHHK